MRCLIIISVSIATLWLGLTATAGDAAPPLSAEEAAVIGEAYNLWKAVGEQVWSGWTKISIPMMYITKDYEYAMDFPKTLPEARSLDQTVLPDKTVQVRKRKHADNLAASFDVEGVNAIVIGRPSALEKSAGEWVITALHEMFHVLQVARGSDKKVRQLHIGPEHDASWQLTFPFPYQDADVMRLVHLQGYLCYAASMSKDAADARYAAGTVLDAVHVYQKFLALRDRESPAGNYSKFQEWTEGTALYTEVKIAQLAVGDYRPTEPFRQLAGFTPYASLWKNRYEGQAFLAKHAGRAAQSRLAFYHLGLAKCLLLDRLMPDWKKRYFDEGVWLDDLLAEAVRAR